ncbi:hypothetical protein PIB30_028623 [Stylosanthes scabra]|uniref:Uncharacterized protein n=1 Tax=Stylosanthes scabra TaxID=79078 RepID=A0ABU6YD95_9FABA|nr:hypothetical protein [Stylosanthes scabra]
MALFSMARILIDCYQWEPIQEWITLNCDDHVFEVFAKEFGGEVGKSILIRSDNRDDSESLVSESSGCPSVIGETQLEGRLDGADNGHGGGRGCIGGGGDEPLIEAIINSTLSNVPECNCSIENVDHIKLNDNGGMGITNGCEEEATGFELLEHFCDEKIDKNVYWADPMIVEANCAKEKWFGVRQEKPTMTSPFDEEGISSSNTCPYPPRFGPCGSGHHVHRVLMQNKQIDPKPTLLIDFSCYPQAIDVVEPQNHDYGELEKTKKLFEEGGLIFRAGCDSLLAKNVDAAEDLKNDQKIGKVKQDKGSGRG